MDRVSESLLNEFSAENGIESLPEKDRFEHFAAYVATRQHNSESFDTADIVTGNDSADIDAIAIVVNETLVTDVDSFNEIAANVSTLDVTFVFVQAKRTSGFDGAAILRIGSGVMDFFSEAPRLPKNEKIADAREIMSAIFTQSIKFKRGNPLCRLYYVTTGQWTGDQDLEVRRESVVAELTNTGLFRDVAFRPIDAGTLQKLYRQTKSAISREFIFANRTPLPEVPGVKESYLGYVPAGEFLKLLRSDSGEIIGTLFDENVRDWMDYIPVNEEIRDTLQSDSKARFVLMNNGVTVIASDVRPTGNKFLLEDYSVVNGCQTSHVLFDQQGAVDDSVNVPIRLISTTDEKVINDIIKATNRQTAVKEEQFYALEIFSKELEAFFQTFPMENRLYYERRTQQYARKPVEKTRIVTPSNMIRAFASMFLNEPVRATRNYAALRATVGDKIFVKGHKYEPYYLSAFALYRLEYLFRSGKLPPVFKFARFHILMTLRIMANPDLPRFFNSKDMEKYCQPIMDALWDADRAETMLLDAATIIDSVPVEAFTRDNIRTEQFTRGVLEALGAA